jgi:proteasome lid subunit RPN8/RPN11
MNEQTLAKVSEHAITEYPKESCGLLLNVKGKEVYVPCDNAHETPTKAFSIPAAQSADAEDRGQILAIVHSHPDGPVRPSAGDKAACEASKLPWIIVAVHKDPAEPDASPKVVGVLDIVPTGEKPPLLGREFVHGVQDCYTLIRDWYREVRGIDLPNFEREDNWWHKGGDLYLENFAKAGFVEVPQLEQVGDVILMQVLSDKVNHAGVYLGNGKFVHHLYGRLSCIDVYGGQWAEMTRKIVRYRGQDDG